MSESARDHGGGLDAACATFGGHRASWADLSTGINPIPYRFRAIPAEAWNALPDHNASDRLVSAARQFWQVPEGADVLATPGLSCAIARIPSLFPAGNVAIPQPTYNEHAATFSAHGWSVNTNDDPQAQVIVHPNNPDGRFWSDQTLPARPARLTVIDESFCDTCPDKSLMQMAPSSGTLILKRFGKFWGLAGLRLGFVIGDPSLVAKLRDNLGPWPVSGPALFVGAEALENRNWAERTRERLALDAKRLDELLLSTGAEVIGGTSLFRLYDVDDAAKWQCRLAQHQIWSRVFPYNRRWLRLGIPHPLHWPRLHAALA